MEQNGKRLTCQMARELDLVEYLKCLGYAPVRIRGNNYWYHSPLRQEKTPSFKVNRALNRWFDFGMGKGGNIIDFGLRYFICSLPDLLHIFAGSNLPPALLPPLRTDSSAKLVITSVKPLTHPALKAYLLSRKIPFALASRFCKEINYQNGSRTYFAIGFENDLGGYELRSQIFKGSSSPKGITHIKTGSDTVIVFEGFIDFLSFLVLTGNAGTIAVDVIILNGLSLFQTAIPVFNSYLQVYLLLDNDTAGQNCSRQANGLAPQKVISLNALYSPSKDLNDFLCKGGVLPSSSLPSALKPP